MTTGAGEGGRRPSLLRRWPLIWAVVGYLLVGTVALWPSIRPGRTLVAADLLALHPPYSDLPDQQDVHNVLLLSLIHI